MDNGNERTPAASAVDEIKAFSDSPDPFVYTPAAVHDLQLRAINERFSQSVSRIPLLGKVAKENGIQTIQSTDSLVPLLFSHETYKSYPETFVRNNQWSMMNRWLGTLSMRPTDGIDVSGVTSAELWVNRLEQHGHRTIISGGTSGKSSFLNRTEADFQRACDSIVHNVAISQGITRGARDRPVIFLSPSEGAYVFVSLMHALADAFGRPGSIYWLDESPTATELATRITALRRRVADGSATPGELTELEQATQRRKDEMQEAVGVLVDALLRHKDEPVLVVGMWFPHYVLIEEAHRRGVADGILHPQSSVFSGGGTKGAKLPADYKQQIERFYGVSPARWYGVYGMVEMLTGMMECPSHRYHCPPWVKILVLDKAGERLAPVEGGVAEGRMAFFDIAVDARWGGIITGDKVRVDFNPCPCGRHSPSVTSVQRYSDLPEGDDKLSCAGSISSYIRGEVS